MRYHLQPDKSSSIGPLSPCRLNLKGKISPCIRLGSVIDGNLNLSIHSFRRACRASVITKTINDTDMQFTGSWTFVDDPALVPSADHSYHTTNRSGDQAQYTFQGGFLGLSIKSHILPTMPKPVRFVKQRWSDSFVSCRFIRGIEWTNECFRRFVQRNIVIR